MTVVSYFLILPIHFVLQVLNLGLWGTIIILGGLIKLLLPFSSPQRYLNLWMNQCEINFARCSVALIALFNPLQVKVDIDGELTPQGWYLLLANHRSWLDIVLLMWLAKDRMPAPKFFLKRELLWVPFVGMGAWALDMPFMRRYSSAFLAKHPELKGKDIETTQKSCEKFRHIPTTVINFVEGTRFTEAKRDIKNSGYQHLLPPKAGGIAFTLSAMGDLFTNIVDVTILYHDSPRSVMLDLLSGRLNRVSINAKVMPVSDDVIGDYFNNELFRQQFQQWLNQQWQEKDLQIGQLLEGQ